jgi:isoamylase
MFFLNGQAIGEPDARGEPIVDDSFLVLFNASSRDRRFTIPSAKFGAKWTCVLDTDHNLEQAEMVAAGVKVDVAARSTVVLTRPSMADGGRSPA